MPDASMLAWCDGDVVELDDVTAPGAGCYTTGIWTGRDIRWSTAVIDRLASDAEALGYGTVPHLDVAMGMHLLGFLAFGSGQGIVRFEARQCDGETAHITGNVRELGEHSPEAAVAGTAVIHPGPAVAPGVKIPRPEIDDARGDRDARGLDEVLLFDGEGFLVEGSRFNVLVHTADGAWTLPPLARGGVRGVILRLLLDRLPQLEERDLRIEDLVAAREIVLTNGARGAIRAQKFEGESVAGPGPLLSAAQRALED